MQNSYFTGDLSRSFLYKKWTKNPTPRKPHEVYWNRYRKPVNSGWTGMNDFQMSIMTGSSEPASRTAWRRNSYGGEVLTYVPDRIHYWGVDLPQQNPVHNGFTYDPFGVAFAGEVNDIAMSKLYGKIRKAKESGFDASLFVGELGKTLNLFASTAARINRSYRLLKRGKIREALGVLNTDFAFGTSSMRIKAGDGKMRRVRYRTLVPMKPPPEWSHWVGGVKQGSSKAQLQTAVVRRFTNDHLAWTYGVKPLLDDIDEACQKLASLTISKPPLIRVSGRHMKEETTVLGHRTTKVVLKVQHTLWYTVTDEMVAMAESLGTLNPLSLAYQASPLTFMFDWMLPVGTWLKNLTALFGLTFHSGCTSRSGDTTDTYHYGAKVRSNVSSYSYPDGNGNVLSLLYESFHEDTSAARISLKQGGFIRNVWASFPDAPLPRPRLPADVDNAASKLTSSLEILYQRRSLVKNEPLPRIYRDIPIRRNR